MILVLVIVPIWLTTLCLVTALCVTARSGDRQRCSIDDRGLLDEHPQGTALARGERAGEQWQPHAPTAAGARRAA